MRAKPWDKKYTDLCIYIDKTIYYRDEKNNPIGLRKLTTEEIDNVYTYLYNVIYALSVKKRLFTNKSDYDIFCLESAGDIFMRLEKPDQDFTYKSKHNKPIKSVLNYIKGALGFMSITWRQTNYAQTLNPGYNSEDVLKGIKEYLNIKAGQEYTDKKHDEFKELFENLPYYIDKALNNSIFKKNNLKRYQLLLSQYLSLCNCMTLEKKHLSDSSKKNDSKIIEQLKERGKYIVNYSSDPLITNDLIELQLKRAFFLLEDEANHIIQDNTPSDEDLNNILASAFSTYDTNQTGDF